SCRFASVYFRPAKLHRIVPDRWTKEGGLFYRPLETLAAPGGVSGGRRIFWVRPVQKLWRGTRSRVQPLPEQTSNKLPRPGVIEIPPHVPFSHDQHSGTH